MDEPYQYGDKIQVLVNKKWLDGEWLEFNHRYSRHMVKVTMFPGSSITVTDGYPADMIRHAPTPTTYKWGQIVMVDGGTDNAREGIVICDQPSQTDRSWFVSTPPCCNQWIRADRLTALEAGKVEAVKLETPKVKTVATQEQGGGPPFKPGDIVRIKPEFYDNFGDQYINFEFEVQPFDDPNCLKISAIQNSEIWQLAMPEWIFKVTPTDSPSLGGQTVPLAEHQSIVDLYERQIAKMTDSSQTLSDLRSRLHVLSEEANEAARYAHSCPGHTQSTLKTIAFRLDCLARGVVGEDK